MTFRSTKIACYIGYIVQAIVNCLPPLLYSSFARTLGVSVTEIAGLITINFGVQILFDLLSAFVISRIGYRVTVLLAHSFATLGILSLGILPYVMPDPYWGLVIATVLSAAGGGIIEVVVSPIVEALPGDRKASGMALLHSFYCWGHMAVVLLTTLFSFLLKENFVRFVPILFSFLPLVNLFLFRKVPIRQMEETGETVPVRRLFSIKVFYPLCILMLAAGASELAMSEWASFFAENGLGVTKTVGDLLGPCLFAALMGIGRIGYSLFGEKKPISNVLAFSSFCCIGCYLVAALSDNPFIALLGCALTGLTVAVLWPGVYSLGAKICSGGTVMFSFFAFFGDVGCTLGPLTVSLVGGNGADGMRNGMLAVTAFPCILFLVAGILSFVERKKDANGIVHTNSEGENKGSE